MRSVKDFYSTKERETRTEREAGALVHVRKLNNFVKSCMIGDALASLGSRDIVSVLDLAGGQGGDLMKFHFGGVKKLVLVDISDGSIAVKVFVSAQHSRKYSLIKFGFRKQKKGIPA